MERLTRPQVADRASALGYLRAVTRHDFGFDPLDPPGSQSAALDAWRTWLAMDAREAKLVLPVEWRPTGRGDLGGNTLVTTGRRGQVLELDPQGQVAWRFPIRAWSAEKLTNGHVLIAALEEQRILEVDALGNAVWQLTGIGATRAKPLANGNLLIADFVGKRVLEISRRRSVVWQHATPEPCFDVERLPNGHTLFGCANFIREITPDARTVREWAVSGRLNGMQALPGGRLLVANFGANQVVELDSQGRETWRFETLQPSDVFRLADGHTLITSTSRVIEIDEQKQFVREWAKAEYGSARR